MDILITVFFHIFAILFFLVGWIEERDGKKTDEEEDRSNHLVLLLFLLSTIFFFIAGITMMYVTNTYVSGATGEITETMPLEQYQPIGWFGIGFGMFSMYLTVIKSLTILESKEEVE